MVGSMWRRLEPQMPQPTQTFSNVFPAPVFPHYPLFHIVYLAKQKAFLFVPLPPLPHPNHPANIHLSLYERLFATVMEMPATGRAKLALSLQSRVAAPRRKGGQNHKNGGQNEK
ncbi:hypothetical protein ATANTOWER_022577 [Ataeniobius toweri]|uniref:Uncharacterized protein n=1 Tax=Ataeniobius toweri TaxID=208326 RepID=A0ABU7C0W2_9TELE|nr:hypothetical protein [Ataeniobius toweri]